jgi:hypothetical protein
MFSENKYNQKLKNNKKKPDYYKKQSINFIENTIFMVNGKMIIYYFTPFLIKFKKISYFCINVLQVHKKFCNIDIKYIKI